MVDGDEEGIFLQFIITQRSFTYQWNGKEHKYPIDGIVVIDGEVWLVKKVNGNTVEVLSLRDLILWEKSGFDREKVPSWLALCNNLRDNPDCWSNLPPPGITTKIFQIPSNTKAGDRLNAIVSF